jgi:hypothetical protein
MRPQAALWHEMRERTAAQGGSHEQDSDTDIAAAQYQRLGLREVAVMYFLHGPILSWCSRGITLNGRRFAREHSPCAQKRAANYCNLIQGEASRRAQARGRD